MRVRLWLARGLGVVSQNGHCFGCVIFGRANITTLKLKQQEEI